MPYPPRRSLLGLVALLLLTGCTTYTWPDGRRETVWGVPAEDETRTRQQRQAEGIRYRVPGELPERRPSAPDTDR